MLTISNENSNWKKKQKTYIFKLSVSVSEVVRSWLGNVPTKETELIVSYFFGEGGALFLRSGEPQQIACLISPKVEKIWGFFLLKDLFFL